uniref:Uncharacterized protein n=1 Tax=Chromera velia CCMP2878 TaxID=1169474 RepID=A0A0G4ICD5_9ALVE|eukprot:Cvel_12994.t1-p1 / transcript=Cvel_12994.t1 / gene=Cvel_12994 / organism=Chromera_velia_CCMP2878 / gene_product=GA-binding protein subunit beta-1, putative / transcript_product=GA-binding protein subunit beta-1, putative / location=Cvel_scaffold871:30809-39674(-) / protein_length=793 / sequence_SO=supercontig / SO=protein_coding / is_pseudo=false
MIPNCVKTPHIEWAGSNIKNYDPEKLMNYRYFWLAGSEITWITPIAHLIVNCFVVFLGAWQCDSNQESSPLGNCLPLPNTQEALNLTSIVAFILAFFVSLLINRWWTTRVHLGLCFGRSGAAVIHMTSAVYGDDLTSKSLRTDFCRFLNLAHNLIYLNGSGMIDVSHMEKLKAQELVKDDEIAQIKEMAPNQRQTLVYGWCDILIQQAAKLGLMRNKFPNVMILQDDVNFIRTQASMVFTFVQTPIPYSYAHLVVMVCRIFFVQLIIVSAGLIGYGWKEGEYSLIANAFLTLNVLFFVIERLLTLFAVLSNPLGDDPSDFPKEAYKTVTKNTTQKFLTHLLPPSVPPSVAQFDPRKPFKPMEMDLAESMQPAVQPHAATVQPSKYGDSHSFSRDKLPYDNSPAVIGTRLSGENDEEDERSYERNEEPDHEPNWTPTSRGRSPARGGGESSRARGAFVRGDRDGDGDFSFKGDGGGSRGGPKNWTEWESLAADLRSDDHRDHSPYRDRARSSLSERDRDSQWGDTQPDDDWAGGGGGTTRNSSRRRQMSEEDDGGHALGIRNATNKRDLEAKIQANALGVGGGGGEVGFHHGVGSTHEQHFKEAHATSAVVIEIEAGGNFFNSPKWDLEVMILVVPRSELGNQEQQQRTPVQPSVVPGPASTPASGVTPIQGTGDDLYSAATNGDEVKVKGLLAGGVPTDWARPTTGATPLLIAAQFGREGVVSTLLKAGADKNKARNDGMTPLCIAASQGHQGVVATLLKAGADKNRKGGMKGMTPLQVATEKGHHAIVALLK